MSETIGPNISEPQNTPIDPSLFMPQLPGMNTLVFKSSITQSSQENSVAGIDSNSPRLSAPLEVDNTMAYYTLSASMDKIASKVLEGWSKSLEDAAEATKAYLKSSQYLSTIERNSVPSIAKHESSEAVTGKIMIQSPTNLEASASLPIEEIYKYLNYGNYITSPAVAGIVIEASKIGRTTAPGAPDSNTTLAAKESTKSVEIGPEHFIAASLILGAGVLAVSQTTVDPTSATVNVESKVIQDAWSAIFPLQEQASAVLVASWFSAMWGTSMLYLSTAQNIGKYAAVEGGAKKHDIDFAKTYAANLLGNINSPQFERLMLEAVYKSQETAPTENRKDPAKLVLQAKIVLLSVALALVAKLDVAGGLDEGWFNELEFKGLISAKTDLSKEDIHESASIKRLLINEINESIKQLPAEDGQAILASLGEYFYSHPSVTDMLDQQKVFKRVLPEVLNPRNFHEGLLDQLPV